MDSARLPIRIRRVLCYSRRLGRTQEAGDFSRSGGGGRQVPVTGEPTGPVHGDRRDGPAHDRRGDSERPAGLRRLRPFPAAQRRSPVRDLRHGHDRQFVRRQGRVERSARHVHQGAPRTDTAREGDVDQGGISSLSAGGLAHGGGAVCHRGGDGNRVLRHGPAARRAVRRAVALVFPEHAVVPLSPPVPELRVLRTSVRLRAGRHVPRHARRGHDRARPRPRRGAKPVTS